MDLEMRNVRIERVELGMEDHGLFTAVRLIPLGGSASQAFGGRVLDNDPEFGIEFIKRTMAAVGVREWGQLTGKYCRIMADYSHVHAIGHIVEDTWFWPEELAKERDRLLAPKRA
jgi:hypothetical protein